MNEKYTLQFPFTSVREAKEMMDEVADAIDDIKKTIAQAKELVKEAKALKEKCGDIVDSLKKTISAIDALFQQPLDLQTLAGLPKALAAKMQELIDSLPGIRECAGDAGTLIEHAESLFDAITSSVAEATYDSAATLVNQARGTLQTSAPDVSQLAAADITRSL